MRHFIDVSSLDSTINPTEDFFRYVNGKWLDKTEIPADQVAWGGFYLLQHETQQKLKAILEHLQQEHQHLTDNDEKRLGAFFTSGMDTAAIEAKGIAPIQPQLDAINQLTTAAQLIDYVTHAAREGFTFLVEYTIAPDLKNSTVNILNFNQGGINLPDRSYYLDKKNASIKDAYKVYIADLFVLAGEEKAKSEMMAKQVLDLETKMALSHKKIEDLRMPDQNYNKVNRQQMQALVPTLTWNTILANMGFTTDEINVAQPAYYKELGNLLQQVPITIWKNKLKLDLLHSSAEHLSKNFRQAKFAFFNNKLMGQQAEKPRWETIASVINGKIGELLGKIYVKKHFPESAKKRMGQLIDHLFLAYKKRLNEATWMSDTTKQKAFKKLEVIVRKIGYPDKWKTYASVNPNAEDYFGNVLQGRKYAYQEGVDKLGKPVDKTEWFMSPSTVNAYYNPSYNEIVFPAAILQLPFFDEHADDAINYGGIGMVIGHEITHGFDDQGKKFDAEGNLMNWWSANDEKEFNARAEKVGEQYGKYSVAENFNVNGKLTMGENIADIGGLAIAYDAFQMTEQAKKQEPIDGLTPNERFFMSYAQIWSIKTRPEEEKLSINVDPHSPAKFRVNGPLSNFTPFYETFGSNEKSPYFKAEVDRIRIW